MHSYAWIAHTKLQHDEIEVIDGFSNFGSLILFMDPLIIKLGVLTQPEKQVFMCMILNLWVNKIIHWYLKNLILREV